MTTPPSHAQRFYTHSSLSLSPFRNVSSSLLRAAATTSARAPPNACTRELKECDFDGRRRWQRKSTAAALVAAAGCITDSQDYVVLGGLKGPDHALRSLTATVHFQIDPVHRVEKATGPLQVSKQSFSCGVRDFSLDVVSPPLMRCALGRQTLRAVL